MKYGRSLSFCVKDILDGKVSYNEVGKIVASTACKNDDDWVKVVEQYMLSYWYGYSFLDCKSIVWGLLDANKIEQPRLTSGKMQAMYKYGNWANTYQEVIDSLE